MEVSYCTSFHHMHVDRRSGGSPQKAGAGVIFSAGAENEEKLWCKVADNRLLPCENDRASQMDLKVSAKDPQASYTKVCQPLSQSHETLDFL